MRAALADEFVAHDQRRAGAGQVEGAEAYVASMAMRWDLAPDVQLDEIPGGLAHTQYGGVGLGRAFGTLADGGAFETSVVSVAVVERGRIARLELFELDDVDAALARFAALCAGMR